MILLRSRSTILTLGLATLLTGGLIVACTGDDATTPDATPDASTDSDASTPPPGDDSGGGGEDAGTDPETDADTLEDAGPDIDGDIIGDPDGGDPIDLDGGDGEIEPEPDGGADGGTIADAGAGKCNELTAAGTIDAACTNKFELAGGGTLVAGHYSLSSVSVYQKDCSIGFTQTVHGGNLVLEKNPKGNIFTASYVLTIRTKGSFSRPVTARYQQTLTPNGAAQGSPATVKNVCPEKDDSTLVYTSKTTNKITTLTFSAPYGKGSAVYTWTKGLSILQ